MKLSHAIFICVILGFIIGFLPAAIVFFLVFGWFIVNEDNEGMF